MSLNALFSEQANRILRQEWSPEDIHLLAREISLILLSEQPIRLKSPLKLINDTDGPAIIVIKNNANAENMYAVQDETGETSVTTEVPEETETEEVAKTWPGKITAYNTDTGKALVNIYANGVDADPLRQDIEAIVPFFSTGYEFILDTGCLVREETNGEITAYPVFTKPAGSGGGDDGDTTAPTISNIQIQIVLSDRAYITWETNEAAESIIEYGTVSETYTGLVRNSNLVTSHAEWMVGLSSATTYYFRIKAVDAAGNASFSQELSFTTF